MRVLVVTVIYAAILSINHSHLRWTAHFRFRKWLRPAIRLFPYLLGLCITGSPKGSNSFAGFLAAIICAVLFSLVQYKSMVMILAPGSPELYPPYKSRVEKYRQAGFQVLAGPFQELFYRGSLVVVLQELLPAYLIAIISSLLFVLEHVVQFESGRKWRISDYCLQALVGLVASIIVLYGGTLGAACFFHFLVNLPHTILYFKIPYLKDQKC
ncbi:CPBP family intramembrane glutamic endopeptidase [Bombiscardovia coagulans]|uniref:CAAX protease self-immunity n=1 Tax=Bombiscardovia coagulans TaxID=686666 RepID=A0A261EVF4_9BIFI|nr:CAAX protease self-immunity [Bombiscardovia coagulans]